VCVHIYTRRTATVLAAICEQVLAAASTHICKHMQGMHMYELYDVNTCFVTHRTYDVCNHMSVCAWIF
jgi:hypothetical protein